MRRHRQGWRAVTYGAGWLIALRPADRLLRRPASVVEICRRCQEFEYGQRLTEVVVSDNPAGEVIDLAPIGRALQRLTTHMAALRDEIRVQTAIVARQDAAIVRLGATIAGQDATLNAILEQSSFARWSLSIQRTTDRVRQLEEQL
jgi:hypothetical protein